MDKKDLLLTQEDYEALGLTEEQIALFEDANAIVGSVDLLPDNPAVMIDAIDKLPADYATALKALDEIDEFIKKYGNKCLQQTQKRLQD